MFLCSRQSLKNLAVTLGSCKINVEENVGAGLQNMFVNLFLMAKYAGQYKNKLMFVLC